MKAATWTDEASEVVVMRDGRPLAVVTPFDEDDLEWYTRERDPAFLESLKLARGEVVSGKAISHDQLKKEPGL